MASAHARFGTHQFVGSPAWRRSPKYIAGKPGASKISRSSNG